MIVQKIIHHPKFDDGITVGCDSGVEEEVRDVLETACYPVQEVFTFTASV